MNTETSQGALSGNSLGSSSLDLFASLIRKGQTREPITVAVCWPCSNVSLLGAVEAASAGLIHPKYIGPGSEIRRISAELGVDNRPKTSSTWIRKKRLRRAAPNLPCWPRPGIDERKPAHRHHDEVRPAARGRVAHTAPHQPRLYHAGAALRPRTDDHRRRNQY